MNRTETATAGLEGAGATGVPVTAKVLPERGDENSGPDLQPNSRPAEGERRSSGPARKRLMRLRLRRLTLGTGAMVVLAVAMFAFYHWWTWSQMWVRTDNAYVASHLHQVSSRVAGTVSEVLVDENQWVEAGTAIARLDPRDFEVRREQAQAKLAQARAEMQQAESMVEQAQAQVAREAARARKSALDFQRATLLFQDKTGTISRQEYDQAEAESQVAESTLKAAQVAVTSAAATAKAAAAQVQVAQANLHDAELQLSYTEIQAPVAGRIGRKNLEAGNRVQPGQALAALVQKEVWVTANLKETQLGEIETGQMARLKVDAFPGRIFSGRVESVSPASGAQFALLPPDNATGNFTKIVQRVPVKIVLDEKSLGDCAGRVVPGMSVVAEIRVRTSQGGLLARY